MSEFGKVAVLMGRARLGDAKRPVREGEVPPIGGEREGGAREADE
jgi:hypothetical protein